MKNSNLAEDYVVRSQKRLKAIETLFQEAAWADVVRESQEVVELTLKALLRVSNIEVPRIHDVSSILESQVAQIPTSIHKDLKKLGKISHYMRRDRELSFYGSEDLTPSEFYKKEDAELALKDAKWVVSTVAKVVLKKG